MKTAAWITDPHFNFVQDSTVINLAKKSEEYDCVFITGDISESNELTYHLNLFVKHCDKPIYFVLGNHDFYKGSIDNTVERVKELNNTSLIYLSEKDEPVQLTEDTCVIGHDGWYDGRNGDYELSPIALNDFFYIKDFEYLDKNLRLEKFQELTDKAAKHIEIQLTKACEKYDNIIILTHFPPFAEACWHEGEISDNNFLPYFSNKRVGLAIRRVMYKNKEKRCVVYCGHTHSSGVFNADNNIEVNTGGTEYGYPKIQYEIIIE